MARSYSLDLRERVVAAVAAGQSCRAVAGTFKVSVASVVKWSQRFRATGSAAAKKRGWQRPYAVAGEREWLLARLAEKPDLTLRALQAELAERGLRVSRYAVWHFFEHEGISFKKKPARQRAGSARRGKTARTVEEVSRAA
jgi:transposase